MQKKLKIKEIKELTLMNKNKNYKLILINK